MPTRQDHSRGTKARRLFTTTTMSQNQPENNSGISRPTKKQLLLDIIDRGGLWKLNLDALITDKPETYGYKNEHSKIKQIRNRVNHYKTGVVRNSTTRNLWSTCSALHASSASSIHRSPRKTPAPSCCRLSSLKYEWLFCDNRPRFRH